MKDNFVLAKQVVRGFSPQNCFPNLYRRSKKPSRKINEMGNVQAEEWIWNLHIADEEIADNLEVVEEHVKVIEVLKVSN